MILIFVALLPYENILTTKFSQITVLCACNVCVCCVLASFPGAVSQCLRMCILNSLYIMYTLNCLASRKPSGCLCFAARHPLPLPTPSPVTGYSLVKKWWWTLQGKSIYVFTAKPIHNINCYMYAWFSSMYSNFVIRGNCTCVGHHGFASLEWGVGSHYWINSIWRFTKWWWLVSLNINSAVNISRWQCQF